MDRLSMGERLFAGGGILLFVLSFVEPWAKVEASGGEIFGGIDFGVSLNAWDGYGFFPLKLGLILAIAGVALVIARLAGMDLSAVPGAAYAGLGGAVLALVLLALALGPAGQSAGVPGLVEVDRGVWLFIALLPAAAVGVGGYLVMQERAGAGPGAASIDAPPPPSEA